MRHSLFWLLDHHPETGESVQAVHAAALEQAVDADRLGFSSLWVAEHHFFPLSTAPNPAVLLSAIAQRTERLRVGPAAAVLPLRDPIHVAEDYALLDALSDGRLNFGVGCGSRPQEYAPFGVDFEERREPFARNLADIRRRWRSAARGETGPDALNVAPVQSPAPPVYVATMDEETAYRVGLSGDSLLTLVPPSSETLAAPVARVNAHARGLREAEQPDARAESVIMAFAHVAPTEAEVRATVVPALSRLMSALTGKPLTAPETLYEEMRERGTGLFGTPHDVAQRLQELTDAGVHHVAFVSRFGGMSTQAASRSLQLLAPDALPLRSKRAPARP